SCKSPSSYSRMRKAIPVEVEHCSAASRQGRNTFVIPSGARDLLFAIDKRKSRFLIPFKKRTGFGMTIAGIIQPLLNRQHQRDRGGIRKGLEAQGFQFPR